MSVLQVCVSPITLAHGSFQFKTFLPRGWYPFCPTFLLRFLRYPVCVPRRTQKTFIGWALGPPAFFCYPPFSKNDTPCYDLHFRPYATTSRCTRFLKPQYHDRFPAGHLCNLKDERLFFA